jgi:hypothetical protein
MDERTPTDATDARFQGTVQNRIAYDPAFGEALLREEKRSTECLGGSQ